MRKFVAVNALLLSSIPVIFFAIAIVQVKHPVVVYPSFPAALEQHNKDLVVALGDTPYNSSVPMQEELVRLRLAMRGRQDGEKTDVKMVLHVSMGIGDAHLPTRIAWLPALLCCFLSVCVLGIVIAAFCINKADDWASNMATIGTEREDVASHDDIVLRMRKYENPHQPKEMTEATRALNMDTLLSTMSARKWASIAPSVLPLVILGTAILIQSGLLEAVQGGGLAIKMFGIFRRAASLSPMECETVLDYIILVLNFPTQIVFYVALARLASALGAIFYALFGNQEQVTPLMLTSD